MSNFEQIYALGIVAHPDDESYLMAGSAILFAQKNQSFGLICATKGEKGSSKLPGPMTEEQVGKTREQELHKAAEIFQAKCVEVLNYPDGGLAQTNFDDLVADLTARINRYQPKIIITFGPEGVSGHKDHQTIGLAALAAAKQANPKPSEVWLCSRPASQIDLWNEYVEKMRVHHTHFRPEKLQGVPDEQLLVLDTAAVREAKLKCIYCHQSQGLPGWMQHNIPKLEESLLNYEYFEVIKI
ncbi:MAG: PIG-L family deacetylase [Candidatus Doudnabacteria bacterium]|nr:PIG-L family deacetylase [Candidatus Doudnabacteria bacterium]